MCCYIAVILELTTSCSAKINGRSLYRRASSHLNSSLLHLFDQNSAPSKPLICKRFVDNLFLHAPPHSFPRPRLIPFLRLASTLPRFRVACTERSLASFLPFWAFVILPRLALNRQSFPLFQSNVRQCTRLISVYPIAGCHLRSLLHLMTPAGPTGTHKAPFYSVDFPHRT